MSTTTTTPPDPAAPRVFANDLENQYARLRMLVHATAVSVLILTGTLFVFLYRQVILVRRQTAELARYVNEVDRSGMPDFVEQVRVKFNEFRKSHPDFNPIYTKYFGTNEIAVRPKVSPAPTGMTNAGQKGAPR